MEGGQGRPALSRGQSGSERGGRLLFAFAAAEAVLLGHVVEVFPIHLGFPSCGADVSAVAAEEPLDVAALELRVVLGARLAVALLRLEVERRVGGRACAGE